MGTAVGENNEGPCAGDSGGPMLVWDGEDWSVVATLKGGGFDCRTGNLISRDDKWSSSESRGFRCLTAMVARPHSQLVMVGRPHSQSVMVGRPHSQLVMVGSPHCLPAMVVFI